MSELNLEQAYEKLEAVLTAEGDMGDVCKVLSDLRFLHNNVLCKFTIDPAKLSSNDCSLSAFMICPLSKYDIYSMNTMTDLKAENWRNRANAVKYQSQYDKMVAANEEKFSHKYYILKECLASFFQNGETKMNESEKDSFKNIMNYAKMSPQFCESMRELLLEEDSELLQFSGFLRHATHLMVPAISKPSRTEQASDYAKHKVASFNIEAKKARENLGRKTNDLRSKVTAFLSKFKFGNIKAYFVSKWELFKENWRRTKEFVHRKVAIDKLKGKASSNSESATRVMHNMLSTLGTAVSLSLKSLSKSFDPYLHKLQKNLDGSDAVLFEAEEYNPDIILDDRTSSKD
jgi:hypothetical protein